MKLTNIIESAKVRLALLLLLIIALPAAIIISQQRQNLEQHALSNSKLGVYFLTVNLNADSPTRHMIAGCPKFIKVNDPQSIGPHMQLLRDYKAQCPGGKTIMRVYTGGRGELFYPFSQDPTAAANDYWGRLQTEVNKLSAQDKSYIDYLTGPNENDNTDYPGNVASNYDWTNTFWTVLAEKIASAGFKPLMGQTGAFFEGGSINLLYVSRLQPSLTRIQQLGGAWSVHPYTNTYSKDVTTELRTSLWHRKVAEKVSSPMIFGEAGFNGTQGGGGAGDGYMNVPGCSGNLDCAKQKYQDWLAWWDGQIRNDGYVLGSTLFQAGGTQSYEFPSFNIDPMACWLREYLGGGACQSSQPTNTPVPNQPTNTPLPNQPTNTPAPQGNTPPDGGLDVIDPQGRAFGLTSDPDIRSAQIQAHFWVDGPEGQGTYAGTVNANQDFNNGQGPHSFIFTIPNNFRDGQDHQLYAYGLDYQGVKNGQLSGTPKTFNLRDSAPPDPTNAPEPPPPGGNNPNPEQNPPPKPRNLRISCNLPNRTVRLQWDSGGSSPHTDFYFLHVRGQTTLDVRVYPTSYTLPVQLGKQYSWWIEAVNHTENYARANSTDSVGGPNVKCDYPPLPTQPRPTSPNQPTSTPPAPTSPGGAGQTSIIIEIKNQTTGNLIDARSGNIYISTEDGRDSDNYNLSGAAVQSACSRLAAGRIKCNKYADKWYGGMSDNNVTDGYSIYDAGVSRGQDTPVTLLRGGTVTITVLLTPTTGGPGGPGGSNPDFVANCLNIQGPTTIRLGSKATYLAQFSGPNDGQLSGTINALKTTNPNPKDSTSWEWVNEGNWPPKELGYTNGVLTYEWTPKEAGIYQVFCRAFNANAGNAECRGPANTVDGPPRYWCKGPGASLTVNVTAAGANDPDSQADMCEFATTIGGNVMQLGEGNNAKGPLLITAIAKAGVNVKTYSFSFYNLENSPDNPKPIYFAANTPYVISSATNSVTVPEDVFTKPDLNNNGKPAQNILINAYFTDADGTQSLSDPKCSITIQAANPTPTSVPTNTPTPTPPSGGGAGAIIATMGVLIIAVIVSLNFFFH